MKELERRSPCKRRGTVGPDYWANVGKRLLYLSEQNRPFKVEIHALSPSDTAITLAFREFGQLLPTFVKKQPKRRVMAQRPNNVAVALWVEMGDLKILLGSDLENLDDDRVGWKAVVLSQIRPIGKAFVVKVPHHGSENSYCQEMWTQMVTANPIALITPFSSGKRPLPTKAGIRRIRGHTPNIYLTGRTSGWKPIKRDSAVERTIKEMVRTRRVIHGPMGQVRVRFSQAKGFATPNIELFGGAELLKENSF